MRVAIWVKPSSKKGPLVEEVDEGLIVYVPEPAVDGRANAAVIALLAKHLKLPKSSITLVAGGRSRRKWVEIKEN